jgi:hypothetical protein
MPDTPPDARPGETSSLSTGPGRILVFVYGLFAVAATGRSAVQLGTEASKAPLAYSLSLFAAVVYCVATTCLLMGGRRAWQVAVVSVSVELVGVLVVGALSYGDTGLFSDKTVWSHFGSGYGFVPLVLPFLGLAWLRHTRAHS